MHDLGRQATAIQQKLDNATKVYEAAPEAVKIVMITAGTEQIDTALKNLLDLALVWDNQFGLTGPGTRYDVYRGTLTELRDSGGFADGLCQV